MQNGRKTSRQIQAEHTKSRILDTVTQILREKSYDEMGIQEICRRSGCSVGAFYHHFENKAGLIVELYKDCDTFFSHEVMDMMKDMEPRDAVIAYLCHQVKYGEDIGVDTTKNVYKAQIDNGNEFFLSAGRGLPKGLEAQLVRLEENGMLKEGTDVKELTRELLVISRGILYNWCLSDGKSDMISDVKKICGSYLKGFLK